MKTGLAETPLITLPQLGKPLNVGPDAVEGAARRAGIEPTRGADGIRRFTWNEAVRVHVELQKGSRR